MITRRTLLKTTAGSLAALGAGLVGADEFLYPKLENKADGSRIYDYVYGMPKSEAVDFVLANMSDDGRFCFGTSEFYFNADLIPEIALKVFGDNNPGVDMTLIGEPFDQSLWQAIAAGAYCAHAKNKECVLFVSPQWFFKSGGAQNKFSGKFNYELYRNFCQNTMLSQTTKDKVRERARGLGISSDTLAAANQDTPFDTLNDLQIHEEKTLRIRSELEKMIQGSPSKSKARLQGIPTGEPDWEAWLEQATADGQARCTNNEIGVYDSYWEKNRNYQSERGQNFDEAESEWSDLSLFLDVTRECGMSVLMIMLPMHGPWYDHVGINESQRAAWYARVRDVADSAGATYADFSPCEYERYFFCDTVHPGWRGWVHIERAVYHFVNGQDDEFLGGWGYGNAEGAGTDDMRGIQL